jgi:hypothetical protein
MLRERVLKPRPFVVGLVVWAALWLALPASGGAVPLPPRPAAALADPEAAIGAIEARLAAQALHALGLAAGDVETLLARLTPEERAELVARADELAVGGDAVLILIAVILALSLLLYLPMAGRQAGWWP